MFAFKTAAAFLLAVAAASSPSDDMQTTATGSVYDPVTTTTSSQSFINTETVTCLHEACMQGLSYCWYWPTMAVDIGSLGAKPAFTLAPFATCTEEQYQATSTLRTVAIASTSTSTERDDTEKAATTVC